MNSKVLLVDDSSTMIKVIKNYLLQMGIDEDSIYEASNGDIGYKLTLNQQFDLIITDWNMPIMDGVDLVENIRKNEKYKNTPIIMITTRRDKNEIIEALKIGINNYLIKPISYEHFSTKIMKYI